MFHLSLNTIFCSFPDQNTKEIWLAIQSAPFTLNALNTSVNERLLDFRKQILQHDQKVRATEFSQGLAELQTLVSYLNY